MGYLTRATCTDVGAMTTLLERIGPGILVAATGVGAGDLITASLGGSAVGLSLVWAALAGALLKWVLTEGLARWQMATATTLLEGWTSHLGSWIRWVFMAYLLGWSFFTGGAMVSACGVAGTGLLALSARPETSKVLWGLVHSAAGLVLVLLGGFRLFQRLMAACVGLMFVTVLTTAVLAAPGWGAVARGLVPSLPSGGSGWLLGVLGGVGGTVTLLSYGYWIAEQGRSGRSGLATCRLDLALGYAMTGLFGVAMVIIGARVQISGGGAGVALVLADELARTLGAPGRWIFLFGFWGAVFSSLLGVWQGVPYLFADFLSLSSGRRREVTDYSRTWPYRGYLLALALVPLPMLWTSVKRAQLAYAILGALFMPLLALTLLLMNNRRAWVGQRFTNGWGTNLALGATLLLFGYIGALQAAHRLGQLLG